MSGKHRGLVDALALPGLSAIDFEPHRVEIRSREADLYLKYLLDTNVVSELREIGDGKADPHLVTWIGAEDAAGFFISAITVLELERGVLGVQRRDAPQGARLRSWLDSHVRPEFAGRILPIDDAVATRCAHLHIPGRRNEADALIAATALVHVMIVVTRNIRDFEGTGVVVVDPWHG